MASSALSRGVYQTEHEPTEARLSIGWHDGVPEQGDHSLERAAMYAVILARMLAAAGYQALRLDVDLRRGEHGVGEHGVLEMRVHGDVPGMVEAEFDRLARATLHAPNLLHEASDSNDVVLWASLDQLNSLGRLPGEVELAPGALAGPSAASIAQIHDQPRGVVGSLPLGRLVAALFVGGLLGVLGLPRFDLPRFDLPFPATSDQSRAVAVVQELPTPALAQPTVALVLPTATVAPAAPATSLSAPRLLLIERFANPLPQWPNNPDGTAWFGPDGYRLLARQSTRFVAVGIPLQQPVSSAILSAHFRKVGGPPGGGYGLIVRDQGSAAERDGRAQAGQYMVLEVGDSGDVGIWQRNETRWIDVLPWTHSEAVLTGRQMNVLSVTTRDNALRFEVNGQVVADLTYDGVPPRGNIGIFVGGDQNEVILDWLRIEGS